ncbi:MAG: hypothetical protein AVDCRST_MAG26-617, partial [uncultured Chloroflexia bacterium]
CSNIHSPHIRATRQRSTTCTASSTTRTRCRHRPIMRASTS